MHPLKRLVLQFLIAGVPIAAGIGIAYLTNPFNGIVDLSHPQISFTLLGDEKSIWILSDLFALFWIVTLMNFINIGASGLDGQLSGTTAIAALTIAALSLKFSADITQWPVIILAAITAGAYAGFMLGLLSILSTTKVGTLMVVLAVPIIDTGFTVFRRLASGRSPLWGDRGHLHHKLLDAGWSKSKVAFFYWSVTASLGLIALNLNAHFKLYTIVGVSIFIGGTLLWLTYSQKVK